MSTVVRPSGPLPPRVYWVRRLLLLVVVAALVWGVARVVGGGDPANGEPARDSTSATPDTPSDDTTERKAELTPREQRRRERLAERAKLRRSQRVADVAQTLDVPSGPCDLTLVRVVPEVPGPSYAGTPVLLRLGLRTEQATPCTIDLDADRLLLSVSSVGQAVVDGVSTETTEIVWSSAQCRDAVPIRSVVLRPSWTSTVDLSWSGLHSGRRCRADGPPVDEGSYRLQAAALTGEPAAVDFRLLIPEPVDRPAGGPEGDEADEDEQPGREDADDQDQPGGDQDQPGDEDQAGDQDQPGDGDQAGDEDLAGDDQGSGQDGQGGDGAG